MTTLPEVRRKDKLMSEAQVRDFLATGYSGTVATVGPDGWPYAVPLLYVWLDGQIWVHNTRAVGHFRRNIDHEPKVCFLVEEPGQIFPYGRFECDTSIAYRSAVAFGHIRIVQDEVHKTAFFDAFMAKYNDPNWARPEGFYPRLDQVTVYAITVERMTGKETPLPAAEKRWPAVDNTKSPHAAPQAK